MVGAARPAISSFLAGITPCKRSFTSLPEALSPGAIPYFESRFPLSRMQLIIKRILLVNLYLFRSTNHKTMEQQKNRPDHLLDGTRLTYTYENGSSVEVHFDKGQFHFNWISGPFQGAQGAEGYKCRKIADKVYAVSIFMPNKTFATLIYNFQAMTVCASVLFTPCTETEMVMFEGGVIDQLELHEA